MSIGFYSRPCYIKSGKIDYNNLSSILLNRGGFDIYINDELRHVTDVSSYSLEPGETIRYSDMDSNTIIYMDDMLRVSNRIAGQLNAMFYLENSCYLYLAPFPEDKGAYSISFALPPTDDTQYDLSSVLCLTKDTGATIVSSAIIESGVLNWKRINNFNTTSFYVKIEDSTFSSVLSELVSSASSGVIESFKYDQSRNFTLRNSYDGKEVFIRYGEFLIKKYYLNNIDFNNETNKNLYLVYYGATEDQIKNIDSVI